MECADTAGMTLARRLFVPADAAGSYHCVSRCVRRAWLCGLDPLSGIDYAHRKPWVEDRLQRLSDIFAVGIYGYAVMSNHLHVVLRVDPQATQRWSDDEVARRWCRLYPPREDSPVVFEQRCLDLSRQPERLTALRERLGSVSWFMRCLNEPLARAANREDGCTGRFWEGRFKCQVLADERAVLAAMAYVDLNPIRAGMTVRLDRSHHTSIQQRVLNCRSDESNRQLPLRPLLGVGPALSLTQSAYVDLVQWTGQQVRPDKTGAIPKYAPSALAKTGVAAKHWPTQVKAVGSGYWRMIGNAEQLIETAEQLGQRWLKGIGTARRLATA